MVSGLFCSGARGVRECGEAAMALEMGLRCCVVSVLASTVLWRTYCIVSADDIQDSPSGHDLRNVAQSYGLFALPCCAELDLQALDYVRVQASSAPQLRKVVCELFNCLQNRLFKLSHVVDLVGRCRLPSLADRWAGVGLCVRLVGLASLLP